MNRRKIILTAVGVIGVLLGSYFLYNHFAFVTTDNAQVEAPTVMLASKVSGLISEVNVVDGQKVKKGDILLQIDGRDYQNYVNQLKAEMSSLEAKKKDVETNYRRLKELYSKGAVSQQGFDTSQSQYLEVKSKYEALSAQTAQAELNLENTKLKAPEDGSVAKKSAEVGQFASPGVPLIGFVGDKDRWVTANFKETDLESIKIGALVDISIDAIGHQSFQGKVGVIASATGATFALLPPDNATGNFTKVVQRVPVKIYFENLKDSDFENLRVGLSAFVKVHKP